MGFNSIHWTQMDVSDLEKMWIFFLKRDVFPGGYGHIGKIQHRRIWPDWGL